uniref:PriCT-2 domain-containing protein n=1 Tax=Clostridium sp. NkU-1 TaxID=1095009 RepID=UPI000A75E672
MDSTYDLMEVLNHIDPSELDYQGWVNVGMALQHEGYSVDVWDRWSMNDRRYHAGECEQKWRGFHGAGTPVTGGTIVQYARDQGWTPPYDPGTALDWNDTISVEGVVVDGNWVEGREVVEPDRWDPARELIKYLETLFEAGENVGYVVKSYKKEDEEKWVPADRGAYDRTAGQLIELLSQCNGDIGSVLGDYDPEGGAWIRFNPMDGKGAKNENVTDFKYALVESDLMDIEKQHAIIRELELPVACLVHSGGKSLHAIVKIDAADYAEYRKRVDYLYDICKKNGLAIDQQNRNPSRLSRMPGVMRGTQKQFIVDTNIGKESWTEWKEWIESINDDLPDPESLDDVWENLPELAPTLIDGVLRQGHKMLIAGPSKAGKSFLQIEMCIAIAEGKQWLNWACTQGRVMYVNLELDRASCLHRFKDVYQALGWQPKNLKKHRYLELKRKVPAHGQAGPDAYTQGSEKELHSHNH